MCVLMKLPSRLRKKSILGAYSPSSSCPSPPWGQLKSPPYYVPHSTIPQKFSQPASPTLSLSSSPISTQTPSLSYQMSSLSPTTSQSPSSPVLVSTSPNTNPNGFDLVVDLGGFSPIAQPVCPPPSSCYIITRNMSKVAHLNPSVSLIEKSILPEPTCFSQAHNFPKWWQAL